MKRDEKILLRVQLPIWFLCLLAVCACGLIAVVSAVGLRLFQTGIDWTDSKPWKALFALIVIVLLLSVLRNSFSFILVSSGGFEVHRLWGVKRTVLWDDT